MKEDKLEKHRRVEQREKPDFFDKWLESNCHKAVSHEKLRNTISGKEKAIEKLIEE